MQQTVELKCVRRANLITKLGQATVKPTDPSYARPCVYCKQEVLVSALAEALNSGKAKAPGVGMSVPDARRVKMIYVCDVCEPTPLPPSNTLPGPDAR